MNETLPPSVGFVSAATVKAMLSDGREIAFLDVREHGQYGEGHPLLVVNCPFSRLEIDVVKLAPNRGCRIVLLDDGDGIAELAAERMVAIGYSSVFVVEGGAPAWAQAGYVLFKGVNVPSKIFGELVEEGMGTPSVSAEELKAMIDGGENLIVLDGRSPAEYNRMNVPTAQSCPNGELPYRVAELAPDPSTRVVINCAGRTRSIIGAQTLRSLGIPNEVVALRNGSQGWQLAGFELEYGNEPEQLPEPGHDPHADERRARFIAENSIETIDISALSRWRSDSSRTTFVFDVRTAEEYVEGHLPGALYAPGGQLVQATDHWVGVRNARIVLCDNRSLRAATTCNWLSLMGHNAFVLDCDVTRIATLERGMGPNGSVLPRITPIDAEQLKTLQEPLLIDVSSSLNYRQAHVAGANWAIRPLLSRFGTAGDVPIVVMARDARVAMLAAGDLLRQGHGDVRVLTGGLADWQAAGLEIVSTPDTPPDPERIDFLFFVHDRHDGSLESARTYLKWETELVGQLDAAERSVFRKLDMRLSGRDR